MNKTLRLLLRYLCSRVVRMWDMKSGDHGAFQKVYMSLRQKVIVAYLKEGPCIVFDLRGILRKPQ
jgi:hypothetical protein